MAPSVHEVIVADWADAEARERAARGARVSDGLPHRTPQTPEQVRGVAAHVRFTAEGSPFDRHTSVVRTVAGGTHTAGPIDVRTGGERQARAGFFAVDESGPTTEITDTWPEPYEPPASRALVERD